MAENRKESVTSTNSAASPTAQQFPESGAGVAPAPAETAETGTATTTEPKSPDSPMSPTIRGDRRASAEWDASKVPPSRFQKRKGSIYAVPGSRDGRVDHDYAAKFHEKLVQLGYVKK